MAEKTKKKVGKENVKAKAKARLNMRLTLMAFALLPMIISVVIVSVILISTSSSELKDSTRASMQSTVEKVGQAFDYSTDNYCNIIDSFSKAPAIMNYLKNPDDQELYAIAEKYTVDFYNSLEGFEGIYLADWNSQVLTHPAEPVVGKVMREGDRLEELRNGMLSAGKIYNVGIMASPASGELIRSFYYPIYDEDGQPIGYIGAGTYINNVLDKFADVTDLDLSTAYIYVVDSKGTILYHPTADKIGTESENAAVKTLTGRIGSGEHPTPGIMEYLYKGAMKYAAYYVGDENDYIALLTADESEVMASIQKNINMTIIVCLICVVIFIILAIIVAQKVTKPLAKVVDAINKISTGDVTAECDAKSGISETASIIEAFGSLKDALYTSMSNVKESAEALNNSIMSVDSMTNDNVDSVSQISVAIDEVASTSQAVAQNAQTIAERSVELGENIGTLNDNVSNLYDASLTIKDVNNEATECMKSVSQGAKESVEAVQSIAEKIAETNTAIEDIERAVHAIESIAAQTNLLSLNASIEAARAGEAGAGFAVVASEIRTLADSSAKSANEIKDIIGNVIVLSSSTVEISNKVYEIIRKEESDIETAQDKFNVLSESVESSMSEIDIIKQMAGKLDEIKDDLTNATTDLGAISEELGASAEEVAASCQTVSSACNDTQASTEDMRNVNENMSIAIDFFKL